MEKKGFLEVLEASLLLFDNATEDEIVNKYGLSKFSAACASYINKFIKSYKR